MPGIIAFRRRWSVGSDDLVVPGLFLFSIHLIWLVVLSVILGVVEFNKQVECVSLLWQHMVGYLIVIVASLLLELMISLTALRGSILDTEQRKAIPSLIYIRLVILGIEIVWLVIGGMWIARFYRNCPISTAKDALLGLVICSWFVILSFFITLWCTFDPAGRSWVKMMNYQRSMKASESRFQYRRSGSCTRTWRHRKVLRAYQNSWDQRCRLLFCCMRHSDRSQNSFGDIARLLSDFFRDIDVVPSDVVAGLILLRKYQKIEREAIVKQRLNDTYEYLSGVAVTSDTQFLPLNDPVYYGFFQDVIHYMTFALGAYGWPMYVMNNPSAAVCRLCTNLRCSCFPCFRSSGDNNSATIIKDNCCRCNYEALKQQVETKDVKIVYATFHVDVGITPFFVAVDYSRQKIIISIRGTLSLQDVITDLNAEGEPIPINPPKEDWLGHTGMIQVAVHIQKKLIEDSILDQAFNFNVQRGTQDFKLVIVGHSLGAGAAAILSILLRQQYPDVACFSYSPPGGTLSLPAVEYTKSFITSVVVGKDVVPRIGLHQMESLRADLMHAIKRSKDPKWKTISCSVICCGCTGLPTSAQELKADDSMQLEYKKDKNKAREFVYHSQTSNVALTSHQPLYPPGRIIHIVRHHTTRQEQRYETKWRQVFTKRKPVYQALWANNTDFDEVLISPVMIQDHMPENVLAALNKVITTVGPRKPQRTVEYSNNAMEPDLPGESENSRLLYGPSNSPKLNTPAHRLQLETSFASLFPSSGKSTCKISLQSFCSHSSNNTNTITTNSVMKNDSSSSTFRNLKTNDQVASMAKTVVPWEYESLLYDQYFQKRSSDMDNARYEIGKDKVDLIHDDWFGLAPLATPESLSEVSSISSRASSVVIHHEKPNNLFKERASQKRKYTNGYKTVRETFEENERTFRNPFALRSKNLDNSDSSDSYLDSPPLNRMTRPNFKSIPIIDSRKSSSGESSFLNYGIYSPEKEATVTQELEKTSPRVIRRTLKITTNLAKAYEDANSNRRFEEMMKIRYDKYENETNSSTSAMSRDYEKSSTDLLYVTPNSSSHDSVRFSTPEKLLESVKNRGTGNTLGNILDRRRVLEADEEDDEDDINYHKPTTVILPTDEKFPDIFADRDVREFRFPYLETDFSLSDPDLTAYNLGKEKKPDKKIRFEERVESGISFDQDYEFDIETESSRLIDTRNPSEMSPGEMEDFLMGYESNGGGIADGKTKRDVQADASGAIETKSSQHVPVVYGSENLVSKGHFNSRSAEALPLLANITRDLVSDNKRKYSFSFLTVNKGESSV